MCIFLNTCCKDKYDDQYLAIGCRTTLKDIEFFTKSLKNIKLYKFNNNFYFESISTLKEKIFVKLLLRDLYNRGI